jgi:tetrahydrodipicolinate N-succinyltransferase
MAAEVSADLAGLAERDEDRGTESVLARTVIAALDDKPADTYEAYPRLHLLSHELVVPHGLNLDGIFEVLANVVWTNYGPCTVQHRGHRVGSRSGSGREQPMLSRRPCAEPSCSHPRIRSPSDGIIRHERFSSSTRAWEAKWSDSDWPDKDGGVSDSSPILSSKG